MSANMKNVSINAYINCLQIWENCLQNFICISGFLQDCPMEQPIITYMYYISIFLGADLTFHRAFDLTPDLQEAAKTIQKLGFKRRV